MNNQFVLNERSDIPHKTLISVDQVVFVTTFIQSTLCGIYAKLGFICYQETTLFTNILWQETLGRTLQPDFSFGETR